MAALLIIIEIIIIYYENFKYLLLFLSNKMIIDPTTYNYTFINFFFSLHIILINRVIILHKWVT